MWGKTSVTQPACGDQVFFFFTPYSHPLEMRGRRGKWIGLWEHLLQSRSLFSLGSAGSSQIIQRWMLRCIQRVGVRESSRPGCSLQVNHNHHSSRMPLELLATQYVTGNKTFVLLWSAHKLDQITLLFETAFRHALAFESCLGFFNQWKETKFLLNHFAVFCVQVNNK